jgi:beta-glucosidase
VLVLVHGGSLDVSAERDNAAIGAIVDAFYAGTRGAEAIAATLLGANDHCCGKMATTTYFANYTQEIKMSEMELDVGVGRGYRYYNGSVVFPFGHGLALTTFSMQSSAAAAGAAAELTTEAEPSRVLTYSVNVTNTGAVAGDEVVFLFSQPTSTPSQPASRLLRKLLDFERVHLLPGQWQVVTFDVSSASLRLVDRATGDLVSTPGTFDLVLTNGVAEAARHRVVVAGAEVVVERFPAGA